MRRIVGLVLIGLGVGLVALAIALPTYVYPRVAKVPADPNNTSTAVASGATAFLVRDEAQGGSRQVTGVDVTQVRYTSADSRPDAPKPGPDDVLWRSEVRVDVKGQGLLTAYVEGYSFDNLTGEATNCCGDYRNVEANAVKNTPVTHEGQLLKFPFNTGMRDYRFWDSTALRAPTAAYDGTEVIDGLKTYRFVQDIPAETLPAQLDVPASFFGLTKPGNVKADDVYENRRTLWVEPETGAIVKGTETQHRRLVAEGRELTTFKGTIGYDAKTVSANVDEYSTKSAQLKIVRATGPLVGWILGPVALLLGALLLLVSRRGREDDADDTGFFDAPTDAVVVPAPAKDAPARRPTPSKDAPARRPATPGAAPARRPAPGATRPPTSTRRPSKPGSGDAG